MIRVLFTKKIITDDRNPYKQFLIFRFDEHDKYLFYFNPDQEIETKIEKSIDNSKIYGIGYYNQSNDKNFGKYYFILSIF